MEFSMVIHGPERMNPNDFNSSQPQLLFEEEEEDSNAGSQGRQGQFNDLLANAKTYRITRQRIHIPRNRQWTERQAGG